MKDTLRLFVAAALPYSLQEYLAQEAIHYQSTATRLVPLQNLHLTLHFLGSTPQEALPGIQEQLQQVSQQLEAFRLTLQRLEPGPKPRSPRLVWARFGQSAPFEQLVRDLHQRLSPTSRQMQKPLPHVTIARFRKDKAVPAPLPVIQPQEIVSLEVNEVGLWMSELASPHPVYQVLHTFALGQNK